MKEVELHFQRVEEFYQSNLRPWLLLVYQEAFSSTTDLREEQSSAFQQCAIANGALDSDPLVSELCTAADCLDGSRSLALHEHTE